MAAEGQTAAQLDRRVLLTAPAVTPDDPPSERASAGDATGAGGAGGGVLRVERFQRLHNDVRATPDSR